MKSIHKTIVLVVVTTTATLTAFVTKVQAASFTLPIQPAANATGVTKAQDLFGVDGSGIKIGVISDSFNTAQFTNSPPLDGSGNLDTYETDIAKGYLPDGIQVFNDYPSPTTTDEGRALLQLVHAVAPGASLAIYAIPDPEAGSLNPNPKVFTDIGDGIRTLAAAGANIIVDDAGTYFNEPQPPDGGINQAIDSVFKQGVSYFTSAGNDNPVYPTTGHSNNPNSVVVGAVYYGNDEIFPPQIGLRQGQLDPASSHGDPTLPFIKPDVVAPEGTNISFILDGVSRIDTKTGFDNFFGTSAAAPFAAGVAALLLQAKPDASPSEIYAALRDTAQPLEQPSPNLASGYGLIQADKALLALGVKPQQVPEHSSILTLLALGILSGGLLLKNHQQQ